MHFHLPSMIHLPSSFKSKLERRSRDRSVSNASTVSSIFSRNTSPATSRSSSPSPIRSRGISKPIPIPTCEPSETTAGRPNLTLATPHRRPSLFENLLDNSAAMGFSASPQSMFSHSWEGDDDWREGEDGVWTGGEEEKEFRSVLEPRPVKHVWAGVWEVVEMSEKRSVTGMN